MRTLITLSLILCISSARAQDADLKAVRIDTLADEAPRSIRADANGRLFVGGRTALFVYEPNEQGGYHPRKLLFRFPQGSDVNDVETRGNDLYILTRSALYLIPDGVRKRDNLKLRKLLWGVPRGDDRQGFRAFAWGPEGDLYIAMGAASDAAWTFFSGDDKTPFRGAGAVLRCRPNGSNVQIVARGLRHPDGLVFDRHWNLFCCDSDKESRLLHVTPQVYFDGSLHPMLDGKRTSRLPALTYADAGHLLAGRGADVLRLSIEPRGASFHATEYALFPGKIVAATIGSRGQLFTISSAGEIVMITPKNAPSEAFDVVGATAEKLWQELSDPSWQRRYRAHIEMMRRGGDFLTQANKRLLTAKANDPAFSHLIWLAAKSEQGSLHLLGLVEHSDPRIRVQVTRALTEYPEQLREEPIFAKLLLDENPQVQLAAMSAYFVPKIDWTRAAHTEIERGPACSSDTYLRQTAALLLAEKATRKQLEAMCGRFDPSMRLAGVFAVGYRLTLPSATRPLPSHLPLGKWHDESAYVIEYADGKVDLREHGRVGTFTIAGHWKADKQTDDQNLLWKLLQKMTKDDDDERVRATADRFVTLLSVDQPPKMKSGIAG